MVQHAASISKALAMIEETGRNLRFGRETK
jgi:hypothetical protein